MEKNILVLLGSPSDDYILSELEEVLDEQNISYKYNFASFDRTRDLVSTSISENEYDGVIYAGGLALALAADVVQKLEEKINKLYLADSENLTHGWIPVIGIPLDDNVSDGSDALSSIISSPSGYPRASVGVDRGNVAAYCMGRILNNSSDFSNIKIVRQEEYVPAVMGSVNKIYETLDKLKLNELEIPFEIVDENDLKSNQKEDLVIYVYDDYEKLREFDNANNFFIAAKHKQYTPIDEFSENIKELDNALHVGRSSIDNAAIFAAQIMSLNFPGIFERIKTYREPGRQKYYK